MNSKKLLWNIARYGISAILIWYLLSTTEFSAIYASLRSADPFWLLLAFVLLFVGKLITSYRWQVLLQAQGITIPLRMLIGSLFVGQFFSNFLPTTVGGDAVRIYDTAAYSKETARSVIAVFMDRLIGTFALAALALLALLAGLWLHADVSSFVWLVVAAFVGCGIALLLVFNSTLAVRINQILRAWRLGKISDKIQKVFAAFDMLKDKKAALLGAFLLSMLLQVNVVLHYYFISLSLGLDVSFFLYCIVIPLSLIILLVPVSINGIGLREGIYVFLLGGLGVAAQDAIALSWIAFLMVLSHGIIGGILFALRGSRTRAWWSGLAKYQTTKEGA